MSEQLDRIEVMLTTLIKMVGDVSIDFKKLDSRVELIESDLNETREILIESTAPESEK